MAIVGVIDACISLTNAIIRIGEAAKNAQGLPPKLVDLFEQLPALENLFKKAKQNNDQLDADSRKKAGPILEKCEDTLEELETLFKKVCPVDRANRANRLWSGAKTEVLGRNVKLQELWKKIEGYLEILHKQKILDIGDSLSELKKVMETLAAEEDARYLHQGSGNMNITESGGHSNNQGGGSDNDYKQYNSAGGTMSFGKE